MLLPGNNLTPSAASNGSSNVLGLLFTANLGIATTKKHPRVRNLLGLLFSMNLGVRHR